MTSKRRFCGSCGGERQDGTAFCIFCGQAFTEAGNAGSPSTRAWIEAQRQVTAGDLAAAERRLDEFEQLAGISADTLALRAIIRLKSANLDDARSLLDRALAVGAPSPFVRVKNAEYWLALGLTNKACDELEQARNLAVGNDAIWAQVNRLLQIVNAKARWSFTRGPHAQTTDALQSSTSLDGYPPSISP